MLTRYVNCFDRGNVKCLPFLVIDSLTTHQRFFIIAEIVGRFEENSSVTGSGAYKLTRSVRTRETYTCFKWKCSWWTKHIIKTLPTTIGRIVDHPVQSFACWSSLACVQLTQTLKQLDHLQCYCFNDLDNLKKGFFIGNHLLWLMSLLLEIGKSSNHSSSERHCLVRIMRLVL